MKTKNIILAIAAIVTLCFVSCTEKEPIVQNIVQINNYDSTGLHSSDTTWYQSSMDM